MTLQDIKAGDIVASRGDRRVAPFSGKVLKAKPVNLDFETAYMGKPMFLTIPRHHLTGDVRVMRDGVVHLIPAP